MAEGTITADVGRGASPRVQPYEGLRIVSLSQSVAGGVVCSLLAALGARVVLVEPPGGSALRRLGPFPGDLPDRRSSAAFLHLARGFESVTIDLDTAGGRSLLDAVARGAALVVEEEAPSDPRGLRSQLRAARGTGTGAEFSILSLSAFGLSGPWAERPASDIALFALSGLMANVGDPDREPLQLPDSLQQSFIGIAAFTAAAASLGWQMDTGSPHDVDVAAFDVLTASNPHAISRYSYTGTLQKRVGNLLPQGYPWTLLPCKDGHIGVIAPDRDWDVFCLWMERPDLTKDPRFATRHARSQHVAELEAILTEWTMRYTKDELYREGQLRHLPFGAVLTIEDSLGSPQLAERGFFREVPGRDGALQYAEPPFLFDGVRPTLGAAPELGADTARILMEAGAVGASLELSRLCQEGAI